MALIPLDEYIRIVIGLRMDLKGIRAALERSDLKPHERTNIRRKLSSADREVDALYNNLRGQGLV